MIRHENNHKAIENVVKKALKIYTNIIKTSIINTKKKKIAEMQAR